MECVTIVLPIPPRVLSPNCPAFSRKGYLMRAAAKKKQKRLAEEQTRLLAPDIRWQRASVRLVFYYPVARRRDDVNAAAMLKGAYDGVILAGLLPDDDREHLHTTDVAFALDKANPRVEMIFTREA